jgi:lysophospholipase L1-like esterase
MNQTTRRFQSASAAVLSLLVGLCVCTFAVPLRAQVPSAPAKDDLLARIPDTLRFAATQYEFLLNSLQGATNLPRTVEGGRLKTVAPRDWTSGFFPGSLWYLYEFTDQPKWKAAAQDYTARIEGIKTYGGSHDVGFMLNCSFGNGYRITREPHYRDVLLQGARTLSTRFKPEVGLIRSWDHGTWKYPVIIDNMMNLELLTWAARESGEARLRDLAIQHADHTLKNHYRPDASTWHVVDYNPTNGAVTKKQTHQGAADDSAWARGQAWGLYGYTMMFRETRKPEYLAQAEQVARFLMNHPRLPADKVPYWDFDAPGIPDAPRDASAAAIMASALIELSEHAGPEFGQQYLQLARQQLLSLSSPAYLAKLGENGGFLIMHCVGHKPKNSEVDVPLNYADYYFLEALLRYRNHAVTGKALPAARPQAAATKAEAGSRAERKPEDLRFQPDPALPNVLLLGDSISIGYTLPVRALLQGKANVFRPITANGAAENCSDTGKGVRDLDRWLAAQPKWEVIHFNWGLHDLKHMKPDAPKPTTSADPNDPPLQSVEAYRANLEQLVARLKKTGARLIFATTTPVPEGATNPYRSSADPARYNAAAMGVMKPHGVRVNDLYAFIQPRVAELQLPKNVHFTAQGSAALAEQVSAAITAELAAKPRP